MSSATSATAATAETALLTGPTNLGADGNGSPGAPWHVLWTRSHCEQLVYDQLIAKELHPFLPLIEVWSRRRSLRHQIRIPMFPGYLFLHDKLDKPSDLQVRKVRGLVGILGERWDRRAVVPPQEVEAIGRVVSARLPALPYPYLKEGQRVRIMRGPLADVEGILVRTKPNKGLFVLSVELLRRSVAVEVDCTFAVPV